jgi:hypothetical protein
MDVKCSVLHRATGLERSPKDPIGEQQRRKQLGGYQYLSHSGDTIVTG